MTDDRAGITVSFDRLRQAIGQKPERPARLPADDRSCPRCHSHYRAEEMRRNLRVCPACGHHFPVPGRERLDQLNGGPGWTELWTELRAADPLGFVDLAPYPERARSAEAATGLGEALVTGEIVIAGVPVMAAAMDFAFMGGSMGSVVGEKLARACERAVERGVPLVAVSSSGGARMQEGVLALMQMARTVVAFEAMNDAGLPIVIVLAHPTTGGVWASFAALGDVIYAEPGALIAFSGPRVIEQTTREKLPPDFGRAEAQLGTGQVDAVVDRRELTVRIGRLLGILDRPDRPPLGPLPMQWGKDGAGAAARAAGSLSRRVMDRMGRAANGALPDSLRRRLPDDPGEGA